MLQCVRKVLILRKCTWNLGFKDSIMIKTDPIIAIKDVQANSN